MENRSAVSSYLPNITSIAAKVAKNRHPKSTVITVQIKSKSSNLKFENSLKVLAHELGRASKEDTQQPITRITTTNSHQCREHVFSELELMKMEFVRCEQ